MVVLADMRAGIPLGDGTVQCVVTSPPYWRLRDYGVSGQLGMEGSVEEYVSGLVRVFDEVWRVLRKDGTLWLNMGDSYAGSWGAQGQQNSKSTISKRQIEAAGTGAIEASGTGSLARFSGLKRKDLIGMPWRVAFALQARGWYLRRDIVWDKPNAMPESVRDRPTAAHEYVFLFSKSARYFYDAAGIREPGRASDVLTGGRHGRHELQEAYPQAERRSDRQRGHVRKHAGFNARWDGMTKEEQCSQGRNCRDVWRIATRPGGMSGHFAAFPAELPRRCILAGSRRGDVVLDPFGGTGTTAVVARELGRLGVCCELNREYAAGAAGRLGESRLRQMEMDVA